MCRGSEGGVFYMQDVRILMSGDAVRECRGLD